jgi:hypothetical protein
LIDRLNVLLCLRSHDHVSSFLSFAFPGICIVYIALSEVRITLLRGSARSRLIVCCILKLVM